VEIPWVPFDEVSMPFVRFESVRLRLARIPSPIYWCVLSGLAALMYQVILQKLFSYLLGGALLSTTIVVAAYMTGLTLGGFLTAWFCDRLSARANLLLYASMELGIAIFGVGSLVGYRVYLDHQVALMANPAVVRLMSSVFFRSVFALTALLPMTVLMGATLPVLALGARAGTGDESRDGVRFTSLYSANLLGGMAGVFLSAYLLMPYLGLWGATAVAALGNLGIVALVLRYRTMREPKTQRQPRATAPVAALKSEETVEETLGTASALTLAFLSGLIMFALELIWTHLLATVIGATVYAFANMLLAVFLGLYLAAHREEKRTREVATPLAYLVLWGSVLLALSIPLYALFPLLFSVMGLFSPGFLPRELARLLVAGVLIVPVGYLLSRIFPRLLAVGVPREKRGRALGLLLSVNTFGCLLGLFVADFVLIPRLGSEYSLKGLAVLLALSALLVDRRGEAKRFARGFALAWPVLAVAALVIPSWPPSLLLSNRSTYFNLHAEGEFKPLLYLGEDAESGFVSVGRREDGTLELRTNGKFQGDDREQMSAQYSFGYLPALVSPRTGTAFVIGCGTGVSVRALADAGFSRIDVAEISKPILHAARVYFREANGAILEDPRVTIIHDDGRNALALAPHRYDVISVELSSIWFAGVANLYSADFYTMVHDKLAPDGVFQQWVQFHHMRLRDLYVVLNTVHQRFKYVGLWYSGGQGQIVASDDPLTLDWERMRALAQSHRADRYLSAAEIYQIPFRVVLDPPAMDRFVDAANLRSVLEHNVGRETMPHALFGLYFKQFVDTDMYPDLEYATPRGNVLPRQELLIPAYFAEFVDRPLAVPFRNLPQQDIPLAEALLALRNGRCDSSDILKATPELKAATSAPVTRDTDGDQLAARDAAR
jgi:spermidine synthase